MRKKIIKSVTSMSIGSFASALVSVTQVYILARILSPADFGVVVIPQVTMTACIALITGIPLGLIRKEHYSQDELAVTQTWAHLCAAILFGILLGIGYYYYTQESDVDSLVMMVYGSNLLIVSLGLVHRIIIRRNMEMQVLAIAEFKGTVITSVVTVLLAYSGLGYWSIAYGMIAGSVMSVCSVRLKSSISIVGVGQLRSFPPLVRFGFWRGVDQMLSQYTNNVDRILIGSMLGNASVGSYAVASNLAGRPANLLTPMIGGIMYPVFSRIPAQSNALYVAFNASCRVLGFCTLLIALMFSLFSNEIGAMLLGDGWSNVFPVIAALGYLFAFTMMEMPCRQVTMAFGDVKRLLLWNIFTALLISIAFSIAFYFGADLKQFVYVGVFIRILLYCASFYVFVVGYVPQPWSVLGDTIWRIALPIVFCSALVHLLTIDSFANRFLVFCICSVVILFLNKNLVSILLHTLREK